MGYAKHIGRVGALAVTLGVGLAMATTPGTAFADPDADSSSQSPGGDTKPDPKPAEKPKAKDADKPDAKDTDKSDAKDTDAKDSDAPKEKSKDDGSPKGGEEDSDGQQPEAPNEQPPAESAAEGPVVDELEAGAEPEDATGAEATPPQAPADVPEVPDERPAKKKAAEQAEAPTSVEGAVEQTPKQTARVATFSAEPKKSEAPEPQPLSLAGSAELSSAGEAVASLLRSTAAEPVVSQQQPPTLVGVVTEFVASLLRPLLSGGEGSPIQFPILTAVLAAVRQEFERILYPRKATTTNVQQQNVTVLVDPPPDAIDPTTQHVLVIGVDGTNLSRILADEDNVHFIELMEDSTTASSSIVGHTTISNPSWTAILTGVWGERTGVINNVFTPWTYSRYPTLFNQVEAIDRDIDTMTVANWDVINAISAAGDMPVDTNLYVAQVEGDTDWLETDNKVAALTIDAIESEDPPNLLFSYYVGVDENGHMYGGDSPEYEAAITNMDTNLGAILEAIEESGEEWTIIVVTDHGHQAQQGFGHGFQSPDETETFVIASGAAFEDGYINDDYEIVDTTPTVVTLFGGTPRAGSDGVSLTTLGPGEDPGDTAALVNALKAAIAQNEAPDILTQIRLGVRTVFATIPYYIYDAGPGLTEGLPSILVLPVQVVLDGLYVVTNVPAQIIAFTTGVTGVRLIPLLPPPRPNFPPADDPALDSARLQYVSASCLPAESWCSAGNVA